MSIKHKYFLFLITFGVISSNNVFAVDFIRDIQPIFESKCYSCHNSELQQAGLRLDDKASFMKGGYSGDAIVAGNSEESLLFQLITNQPPKLFMPMSGERLPDDEIQLIKDWIDEGAPWQETKSQPLQSINEEIETHWAFIPPKFNSPPQVNHSNWVRNPIDAFILNKLEEENLKPSPEADRETLLRRLKLDLLGIPPTPEEIDEFLLDQSPNAYEKFVDKFLNSNHYGERWGRHWLDVARYADSNGFSIDGPRSIWKYRDWVIDALNEDMSFDRFIIYQLAGDLLPNPSIESQVATGFHRNTKINQEGGIDEEQFRVESVVDRVNTTGTAFLGLTIACAQCHDHKFDPISQKEYYQLFDIFNQDTEPELPVPSPKEQKRLDAYNTQLNLLEEELKKYRTTLRDELNQQEDSERYEEDQWKDIIDQDEGYQYRVRSINEIKKEKPDVTTTMILRKREEPRDTYIHIQGDFTREGQKVQGNVPAVLHPLYTTNERPTRLDLALWLVSPDNPITARVTINRIWQRYFGVGIVQTENDFGTRGSPPTHPALLDWLAIKLMRSNWSLKTMHYLIVTSSTYRQSSYFRSDLKEVDPYNKLLARQNRIRLDAEIIRDSALAVSGLLNPSIGGPGVYPPQPEGVTKLGQVQREWNVSPEDDRYRRGMYTFFWRATPHPALMVFDMPDSNSTCTRRNRSNIPLQALTLLNDEAFFECAVILAEHILRKEHSKDQEKIRHAFKIVLSREPHADEIATLQKLLENQRESFSQSPEEAKAVVKWSNDSSIGNKELAAWSMVTRTLLNLDEFITRE